jgi:hypothetical protein
MGVHSELDSETFREKTRVRWRLPDSILYPLRGTRESNAAWWPFTEMYTLRSEPPSSSIRTCLAILGKLAWATKVFDIGLSAVPFQLGRTVVPKPPKPHELMSRTMKRAPCTSPPRCTGHRFAVMPPCTHSPSHDPTSQGHPVASEDGY